MSCGTFVVPFPDFPFHRGSDQNGQLQRNRRLFRERVKESAKGCHLTEDLLALDLRFYTPAAAGQDLDNLIKPLLDALTGVLFADDDQIAELHAFRFDGAAKPRIEVRFGNLSYDWLSEQAGEYAQAGVKPKQLQEIARRLHRSDLTGGDTGKH